MIPWDQRIARMLVKPLAHTPLTPNHLTSITLVVAVAGAMLLATGDPVAANWGAGLFVLARFMDHFDGELARLTGQTSRFGYYFDYVAGALSYAALFLGIGIGMMNSELGNWALALGAAGALSALISMPLNLGIDETSSTDSAVGYPAMAGFELEDGIYLIAPITWLGFLQYFFVAAGIGAAIYCLWTGWCLVRIRKLT
jgi:archaetidylinositol phosphate synthase